MEETLFESILKENSLVDMMIKDFDDVEVGDIGEDYDGNKVRIIAKGTIGDLLDHDSTGAAKEYVCEDGVAVEKLHSKDRQYSSYVYEYGPSGVVVYEKI